MVKAINNALMKATAHAIFLAFYEKHEPGAPLPDPLWKAALTAFLLQLVSVFDDGLDEAWMGRR